MKIPKKLPAIPGADVVAQGEDHLVLVAGLVIEGPDTPKGALAWLEERGPIESPSRGDVTDVLCRVFEAARDSRVTGRQTVTPKTARDEAVAVIEHQFARMRILRAEERAVKLQARLDSVALSPSARVLTRGELGAARQEAARATKELAQDKWADITVDGIPFSLRLIHVLRRALGVREIQVETLAMSGGSLQDFALLTAPGRGIGVVMRRRLDRAR